MAKSKWKEASHHISSEKCKFKQHWDTVAHLLEWPKPETLTTLNANENVEQQELSYIADENAKWYSHLGRQFGDFWQN